LHATKLFELLNFLHCITAYLRNTQTWVSWVGPGLIHFMWTMKTNDDNTQYF